MPAERIIFGKKVRRRSVNNVIEELKILREKYNFKSLLIHDDCITEDANWVEEFCYQYKKNGFKQPFACQSRADFICRRDDLIKLMADAGLNIVLIGFESGSQRVLNFLRKGTTVEQNLLAAKILRKYNIKIWANYILGIPTETKEEIMDTVMMLKEIKPEHPSPAFFTPHPGSDLFKYCKENDLILFTNHDSYRRNPTEAKIKDIDYDFLKWALAESANYIPIINLISYIEAAEKKTLNNTIFDFNKQIIKNIKLNGERKESILIPLGSKIGFKLFLPKKPILIFGLWMLKAPSHIFYENANFFITIDDGSGEIGLFKYPIDKENNKKNHKWMNMVVNLSSYSKKKVRLFFYAEGYRDNNENLDFVVLGNPVIMSNSVLFRLFYYNLNFFKLVYYYRRGGLKAVLWKSLNYLLKKIWNYNERTR